MKQATEDRDSGSATALPRVLYVDDEAAVLRIVAMMLRKYFHVELAESGAKGLELLADREAFDVIVSDMRMPEMTGIEFFRRAIEVSPLSSRILLTGQADMQIVSSALDEGTLLNFFLKPFEPEMMREQLASALRVRSWACHVRQQCSRLVARSLNALSQVQAGQEAWGPARAQRVRRLLSEVAIATGVPDVWQHNLVTRLLAEHELSTLRRPASADEDLFDDPEVLATCDGHVPLHIGDLLTGRPRLELLAPYLDGDPIGASAATEADYDDTLVAACAEFDRISISEPSSSVAVEALRQQDLPYSNAVLTFLEDDRSMDGFASWDEDTEVDIGPLLDGLFD